MVLAHVAVFVVLASARLLAALPAGADDGAPSREVRITFDAGVSAEDRAHVREGLRLARDYFAAELGVAVETPTTVEVRSGDPGGNAPAGTYDGDRIVVETGHPVWAEQATALHKVKILVHEDVHLLQEELAGNSQAGVAGPQWLVEGSAEYLAYRAVAGKGLVAPADVRAYHLANVVYGTAMPPLRELESAAGFRSVQGPVYSLAALAVERLVAERGVGSLVDFYRRLGDGRPWDDAFVAAFGSEPDAYYAAFEADRLGFVVPEPVPFFLQLPAPAVEGAFDVTIASATDPIARGDQAVLTAWTAPGAACRLSFAAPGGVEVLAQPTTADAAGYAFWLWSVGPDLPPGTAVAEISCGSAPAAVAVALV